VVIVLDPTLLSVVKVTAGLKNRGILIINTSKDFATIEKDFGSEWKLALVDANKIARDVLGVTIREHHHAGSTAQSSGSG